MTIPECDEERLEEALEYSDMISSWPLLMNVDGHTVFIEAANTVAEEPLTGTLQFKKGYNVYLVDSQGEKYALTTFTNCFIPVSDFRELVKTAVVERVHKE